jgi:regulator of sirC expression with transglutaminase-like and TPR domain
VEKLVDSVRKSIVVITFSGRDGAREGLGTGFVVGADGLIATNLHVIGEARPISVQTQDGRQHEVTAVHASDRAADLALLRIAAEGLAPLKLADSDSIKQGQPVVAIGNPHGLTHSVVTGVVSGEREIDGRKMIQLAIPIEPGNSGGPLMDLEGRVHGLLTMKSSVTANLGFAVPSNRLKPLLDKPNPIPMDRWLLIGALDAKRWTPLFGARWKQRAGRIAVDGLGAGFGGRSLCLSTAETPEAPYEVAVTVKLDDESGAAGLAFGSDGADRHFGFYPSAGELRLSRFDGPDVNDWQVLVQKPSPHYRPGDWNQLKVRVEIDKVLCYVNDHLVIEANEAPDVAGRLGLAKFRTTRAEFKQFRVGQKLESQQPAQDLVDRVAALSNELAPTGPLSQEVVQDLAPSGDAGLAALRARAERLEQQSAQLRKLAAAVREHQVLAELSRVVESGPEFDLFHAALLIAKLDNDELDVEAYRTEFGRLASELKSHFPIDADEPTRLKALNEYLFATIGFHGSRADYYNRSNSYVNEVLDDREGLPITLSLIYMELARAVGLDVAGVGLPGHFIVKYSPKEGEAQLIDVFESGRVLTREQADALVRGATGRPLVDDDLKPIERQAILARMLRNLYGIAEKAQDVPSMLRYLDGILTISPDSPADRMYRAYFLYQSGMGGRALGDLAWLIEHEPEEINLEGVRGLRDKIEREESAK